MTWKPSASTMAMQLRARLYCSIRQHFIEHPALEVETPILAQAPVTDPNIAPMQTQDGRWLHTSPEYAMKRLLCAGSGDIYQIAKVFRQGEAGQRHNPEFSMLEWYRLGCGLPQLMAEVASLTRRLLSQQWPTLGLKHLSYRQAMQQFAGVDPFEADDAQIAALGQSLAGQALDLTRDGWLDVIMSHRVEPALPGDTLVFIDHFPASQAALAKVSMDDHGVPVAQRFELYFNGYELANGYDELNDPVEQRQRFEREAAGRPIDEALLQALEAGLPACSGVAMGLDRLLMLMCQTNRIADVLTFDWSRA